MRRPIALAAVCLALASVNLTPAGAAEPPAPSSCTPLKVIYAWKNWRDAKPLDGRTACPAESRAGARNTIKTFYLYGRYRRAATYRGLHEGDPWLEWLAVPAYIVRCETQGYYGRGRWTAYNADSGARNLYQFIGWGDPWPVNSIQDKVRAHEIAAGLSLSNWACA